MFSRAVQCPKCKRKQTQRLSIENRQISGLLLNFGLVKQTGSMFWLSSLHQRMHEKDCQKLKGDVKTPQTVDWSDFSSSATIKPKCEIFDFDILNSIVQMATQFAIQAHSCYPQHEPCQLWWPHNVSTIAPPSDPIPHFTQHIFNCGGWISMQIAGRTFDSHRINFIDFSEPVCPRHEILYLRLSSHKEKS